MRTENEVSTELFPRVSSSGRGKEMNNVFINLRKENQQLLFLTREIMSTAFYRNGD